MSELEFIARPELWPRWPLLPLVRGHETAIALESERGNVLVFRGVNMFASLDSLKDGTVMTPQQVIEEGWRVD